MKNSILKIISLSTITLSLIFGFSLKAEAIVMNYNALKYDLNGFTLHGNSTTEDYTIKYTVGGNYVGGVAYCLDAQLPSNVNNLMDVTNLGNNIKDNAYKAGIIAIFNAGGDNSGTTYIAKMLAVRAWSYAFNRGTGATNIGLWHAAEAGFNLYDTWKTDLASLVSTLESKGVILSNVKSSSSSYYYTGTGNNLGTAEGYFATALDAAIKSLDNVSTKNANLIQQPIRLGSLEEYEENGTKKVKLDVIHSFKITNADEKTAFTIRSGVGAFYSVGINLNKKYNGLVAHISKIAINGITIAEGKANVLPILDKDILASYGTRSDTIIIDITAHFEGAIDELKKNCPSSSIDYDIQGILNNTSTNPNSGYIVRMWSSDGNSGSQTYVTVEPGTPEDMPTTTPWRSPNIITSFIKCDSGCALLKEECGADIYADTEACDKYHEMNCISCEKLALDCNHGDGDMRACKKLVEKGCPNDCELLDIVCTVEDIEEEFKKVCENYDIVCPKDCKILLDNCVNDDNIEACEKYIAKEECDNCTLLDKVCTVDVIDPQYEEMCSDYDEKCVCPLLKEKCGDDVYANTEACKEYRDNCLDPDIPMPSLNVCKSYYSKLVCCDKDDNLIVSDSDDVDVYIVGPGKNNPEEPNLKLCFVEKVDNGGSVSDQNGNTYSYGVMESNPYCKVSCKEDYFMQMPTAKKVNAGRYFTFKASVKGSKACFTNTIDQEKFIQELIQLQKDLIQANNDYQTYTALLANEPEIIKDTYTTSCSCSGCTCSPTTAEFEASVVFSGVANLVSAEEGEDYGTFKLSVGAEDVSYTATLQSKVDGETTTTEDIVCTDPKDSNTCQECSDSCTVQSLTSLTCDTACVKRTLEGLRDAAKNQMESLNNEIKQLIETFNNCSRWSTTINFEPKVRYDYYEEDYMNMLINKEENMIKENQSESGASSWYCNYIKYPSASKVTVNNDYDECIGGQGGAVKYRDLEIVQCEASSGCKTVTKSISNAKYMSLESSAQASWKPATLFYNVHLNGEITTDSNKENADALENALPVALSRMRGVYEYNVIMTDLGEFYETGELGRYAGDDPKSLIEGDYLNYACAYIVNIQRETFECKFEENCKDNCVTECKGPHCDFDECEDGDCTTDCLTVGCIYDSKDGSSIYSREVSLNNFLYNGTSAYNWDSSVNAKADKTIKEIQNKADNVYNGVDKDTDQAILSVTITPSIASALRSDQEIEDNKEAKVSCESMTVNGVEYPNIACYSDFIEDILNGGYGMVNEDNSYISDENNRRKDNYFTTWDGVIDDTLMLGPSWK